MRKSVAGLILALTIVCCVAAVSSASPVTTAASGNLEHLAGRSSTVPVTTAPVLPPDEY